MRHSKYHLPAAAAVLVMAVSACSPLPPERDRDIPVRRGHPDGEFKEKYWDGPCKVERERKRNGEYKEERECKNVEPGPYRHPRGDYEEKYWDGPCRIEREWKRDGTYKEKVECREERRGENRGRDDRRDREGRRDRD